MLKKIQQFFPLFEDLQHYSKQTLRYDVIAGLTVGVMIIPQAMAYAVLAGLPPIYGLYGGLLPLFLYAFLGSSRQLSIGPVAVSAILVAEGLSQFSEPFSPEFVGFAITAGLLIGILQTLFGLIRLGFLVNFLSHPVIAGFTSAAAIIIIVSQLSDLLGFKIPRSPHLYDNLVYAFQHIGQSNWISVSMCLSAIVLMLLIKKWNRTIPSALIVVILGTLLSYCFDLPASGLAIVGTVPSGLPGFQLPTLDFATIEQLYPTVITVTIIGIVESIGIAKALEAKHNTYIVRPNQELLALGIAKIGGAFFQALPTSGSFTRSAINNEAGAKTNIAALTTVLVIILTLLFLTPIFYYLPKAILAAIILMAVRNLIDYKEAIHLWHIHRPDFVLMMITFVATLAFGIEEGVLAGVVLSILHLLYKKSRPNISISKTLTDGLIVRFEQQLFFANAAFLKDKIQALLQNNDAKMKVLFLDASMIADIDSSGIAALQDIHRLLHTRAIPFYICETIPSIQAALKRADLVAQMGKSHTLLNLDEAKAHWIDSKS